MNYMSNRYTAFVGCLCSLKRKGNEGRMFQFARKVGISLLRKRGKCCYWECCNWQEQCGSCSWEKDYTELKCSITKNWPWFCCLGRLKQFIFCANILNGKVPLSDVIYFSGLTEFKIFAFIVNFRIKIDITKRYIHTM